MEITKSLLLILILSQTFACSTVEKNRSTVFSKERFDSIKLGDGMSIVSQMLGAPTSKSELSYHEKKIENWDYSNSDDYQSQRAAIAFDLSKGSVDSKTYVVRYGEAEASLEFLKRGIFKDLPFEIYHLQRCSRDYTPATTFYINKETGIIIVTDGKENSVDFYSWNKPEDATKITEEIKACKR